MSALLKELALLRSEVRAIATVRTEMEEMKSALEILQQSVTYPVNLQSNSDQLNSMVTVDEGDTASNNPSAAHRLKFAIQKERLTTCHSDTNQTENCGWQVIV